MSATRRHSAEPAAGRAGSDAAIRGALLIGVAVVIGLLLLWRGHDDDTAGTVGTDGGDTPAVTNPDGSPVTTPDGSSATVAPGTQTTAAPPSTHAPSEVSVLVANGTGTPNGATNVTNKLTPLAYGTLPAANATGTVTTSVVYYREGFQDDARQIAIHLGVAEATAASIVQPMPAEPPVDGAKGKESAKNAEVLVVLGTDEVIKQT